MILITIIGTICLHFLIPNLIPNLILESNSNTACIAFAALTGIVDSYCYIKSYMYNRSYGSRYTNFYVKNELLPAFYYGTVVIYMVAHVFTYMCMNYAYSKKEPIVLIFLILPLVRSFIIKCIFHSFEGK